MKNIIITIIIALIAGAIGANLFTPDSQQIVKKKETAYERVMRTKTLRCGYLVWPPITMKEPNTGKFSGIIYDYVEALGKALELKIEWVEEINFATYLQDLQNGRYDVECAGGWPNAIRGKFAEYVNPIFYLPLTGFVREDDKRFDIDISKANAADVRVATIDGETSSIIRNIRFPKSQNISLAQQLSSPSDLMLQISTGKADIAFVDVITGYDYITKNPKKDKIRPVNSEPVRLIPNGLSVAAGEFRLWNMLNIATNEMLYDGVIEQILSKYEKHPNTLLRVAKPYEGTQ